MLINRLLLSSVMFPPPELKAIAKEVTELLKERKETLSVAETVGFLQCSDLGRLRALVRRDG